MKKNILLLLCILQLIVINSKAQTALFDSLYDYNNESQFAFDVFPLNDSGYVTLAGSLNQFTNNQDILISYYDSHGKLKLNKDYIDAGYQYYIGEWSSFQKTFDGGYVFGGSKYKNSNHSSIALLMKLNAQGDTEFVKTFGNTSTWQVFYRCVQTYDSGYALVGTQVKDWDSSNFDENYYLVRTDKYGSLLWYKSYGGNGQEQAVSICELQNHHLVISGAQKGHLVYYPWIIETDSVGNIVQQKLFDKDAHPCGGGRTAKCYNHQFIMWGCYDTVINKGDYAGPGSVELLDSSFNVKWRIIYNQPEQNDIYEVRQLADSSFILIGFVVSKVEANAMGWITKISKDGEKEWQHYYTHSDNNNYFADVQQTMDKGFIITGAAFDTSIPNYTQDLWLVKLDSNGCLQPGCDLNTGTVEVQPVKPPFNIYPNPASTLLYISNLPHPAVTYSIFNILGEEKQSSVVNSISNPVSIDISALPKGIYFIRLKDKNGFIEGVKFIKE